MRPAQSAGFTLVELLLAAAIAVLIAALAWSLLSTTGRSVSSQEARAAGPAAAARAAERAQADLAALFLPEGDAACALALEENGSRIAFCAVRAAGRTPDLVWSDPRRIEYAVENAGGPDAALVRVEEALAGPLGRVTNRVLSRVAEFAIELHDGADWRRAWPPEGVTPPPIPQRARITVRKEDMADAISAECWIPVGHSFTSRMVRSAAE